jgi:hypothetical protein
MTSFNKTYSKTYPLCTKISDIDKFRECVDKEYYTYSKTPFVR